MVGSATRDLELEAELRAAIAADALVLEYQPVVGPDGLVCTAEALVRWPHPEHGLIPPGDFLPIAQRGGLLRELDEWVLRTACREAAGWPEHGGRPVAVAVNLAGLLPGDPEFRATVTDIVEAAGLPWDRLVLEVVETSLVALPAHALAAMDRLVQCGVRFAIDDFGTGYSSLARLKELPAQIVKVDRAFVRGVATDPADFAVARAVVDMAKAMGRSYGRGGRRDDRPVPRAARGRGGGPPGVAVRAVAAAVAAARAARRGPGRGPSDAGRLIRTTSDW